MTEEITDASRVKTPCAGTRKLIEKTRELLAATFPACFAGKGDDKRPLAIGIGNDILLALPEISRAAVALALSDYTAGVTYRRNILAGAARVGLDGQPAGVVTEQEAAHAKQRVHYFNGQRHAKRAPQSKGSANV